MTVSSGAMTAAEFRALAEFRHQIRIFLNASEEAARNADLEPQQYMLMLALRGLPSSKEASIREIAERMQLRHHTVVELVDRLEKRELMRRERAKADRRQVILHLTPRGERILTKLAKQRISELRTSAPALVRALTAVIKSTQASKAERR
jgi:DNA-binding MarR family transcriptional regulator